MNADAPDAPRGQRRPSRRAFLGMGAGVVGAGVIGGGIVRALSESDGSQVAAAFAEVPAGTRPGTLLYVGRPSGPLMVPEGYGSISRMRAQRPFWVAHRGGSTDWPEMTLYAYTQSVCRGVGALEVSLARTRDGVWFGLHDPTLDRTSGTSGFVAAERVWADVVSHRVTATPSAHPHQPSRPYMRWEELINAYYGSHVLFVDPKNAIEYAGELLDRMDALPGRPQDVLVAKYAGRDPRWAQLARVRGYRTWGYFYAADVSHIAPVQGYWDMLGMDVRADAAAWDEVRGYGKPVLAHVVRSRSDMHAAQRHRADGALVAAVSEVFDPWTFR